MSHANARLTPAGRLIMVRRIATGRPVAHVAAETGATGFSVCMIDLDENTQAGGKLDTVLHMPARILEDDAFRVGAN